jgi:cytochrome P450
LTSTAVPVTDEQREAVRRLVARFDHHDPALSRDPYAVYRALRDKCPVARSEAWDGFWVVSSYELVSQVAHDDATFCSGGGVSYPHAGNARPLIPIEVDPPEFLGYRRLLNPMFSHGAVERMEGDVRQIAGDLVDSFIGRGSCDFMKEFAEPLPARMTLRLLGIDESQWADFLEAIHIGVHESSRDFDKAVDALLEVYVQLAIALDERQQGPGDGDDIISQLARADIDGRPLEDEEILDICLLMLFGGLDTTAAVIGHALVYLNEHPDERALLAAEPGRIADAVEELMRWESPVQGLARTVTRDCELGGRQLRAGEKVWVLWAAANRDEAEFPNAEGVALDRQPNRHFAFGVGIHRCLGAQLGRLMGRVALEEILRRLPDYEVPPRSELRHLPDCAVVYSLESLPGRFPPVSEEPSVEDR